jgi:Cu(I)/Ag(I) efflux system membrane fusion protein
MSRRVLASAAVVALVATAGGGSFAILGHRPAAAVSGTLIAPAAAQASEEPIYYRDPDGRPFYSLAPKKTPDGRDYTAVPPSGDVNFDDEPPAAPPPQAAAGDRKIKFYRNPMGLADTSEVPKKDSMGMDYVPVYEDEDSDDGTVRLSPGKIQRSGVTTEPATRRAIPAVIRASGSIQLDERRVSVISMRSESWIQQIADVTTGSRVVKGQKLMEIYSPQISAAAAEYIATITSKTTGSVSQYGRGSRQRLVNLDLPESAIATIEKTATVPIAIEWVAPRDGIVLERNAQDGMRAQPGDVLFRVADISMVWALLDIAEHDLGKVAAGQPVSIRPRGLIGRSFNGSIERVYPQLNRDTRTVRVRVELANPDSALLPDMYVDAEIDTGSAAPVLTVPDSAVLDTGSKQAVFVDKGNGRYEPRAIKLGHRGGGYVEIRDGVTEGEPVVVSANFLIDAESNLNAALRGFSDAGTRDLGAKP